MDVFKFIVSIRGTIYQKTQEPFIRLITVYTKNGQVVDVGITAKRERMKKARCVGLCNERKIVHIDNGAKIANPGNIDIQKGSFMMIYDFPKKQMEVFKLD